MKSLGLEAIIQGVELASQTPVDGLEFRNLVLSEAFPHDFSGPFTWDFVGRLLGPMVGGCSAAYD